MTERIVRVTGNKKQIEVVKDLIKQAMNQVTWSSFALFFGLAICVFIVKYYFMLLIVHAICDFTLMVADDVIMM